MNSAAGLVTWTVILVALNVAIQLRWSRGARRRDEPPRPMPRITHPSRIAFTIPSLENAPENDCYAARWLEFSSSSWTSGSDREPYPRPRGAR